VNELKQLIQNLGIPKLLVIMAVTLGTMGFVGYLIMKSTKPDMAVLFSQLEPAEAAKIMDRLETLGVPTEIRGEGSQILVPYDRVARLRMEMAQSGLPSSGSLGYEIFDKVDILGTSSAMLDINMLRALEGEIAKSIKSIQGVSSARVHLVMPKKELFSKDRTEPSASIVVKMNRGRLTQAQVAGVQNLVASAVPSLSPERITIVDDKGSLLARQNTSEGFNTTINQEMKQGYEQKMAQTVENLLERTLGSGKVRVEINADMDFDKVTINAEEFNPDGQVVKSATNTTEDTSSSETGSDGGVSVQNALPDNKEQGAAGGNTKSNNQNKRNEENTTYDNSKIIKTHIKESGTIKKVSVAVLVDGTYKDGQYTPRTKEEITQLTTLVKTAVGFQEKRGDIVEIVNMPFPQVEMPPENTSFITTVISKINVNHAIEILISGLISLLVIFLFVKPFVSKLLAQSKANGAQALPSGTATIVSSQGALPAPGQGNVIPETMRIENIEGSMDAAAIKKVRDMTGSNPEEAVTLIRNWIATSAENKQ
jgi:flagellar M-ring protein FliF